MAQPRPLCNYHTKMATVVKRFFLELGMGLTQKSDPDLSDPVCVSGKLLLPMKMNISLRDGLAYLAVPRPKNGGPSARLLLTAARIDRRGQRLRLVARNEAARQDRCPSDARYFRVSTRPRCLRHLQVESGTTVLAPDWAAAASRASATQHGRPRLGSADMPSGEAIHAGCKEVWNNLGMDWLVGYQL